MTPEEYKILKAASLQGLNQVWFEDKMISIPHIKFIQERVENINNPLLDLPHLAPEEQEEAREKLAEIRNRLKKEDKYKLIFLTQKCDGRERSSCLPTKKIIPIKGREVCEAYERLSLVWFE